MKTPSRSLLGFSTAIALAASSNAAITIEDQYAPVAPLGAPTDLGGGTFGYDLDLTSSFSAAGHGKLVLVMSGKDEAGGGDIAGAPVTSVTYDGEALTAAMFTSSDSNRVSVGIFYLDNVATDGNLRIEFADGNQTEFGYGLYAVDGLKTGVQDVAEGVQETAGTVTVTTSQAFVVQEIARNNQSLTPGVGNGYTTLYNYSGPQSYRGLSQFQITSSPGDYYAVTDTGGGTAKYTGAAAFEAVPEPSTGLMAILGAGLFLRRRRRA